MLDKNKFQEIFKTELNNLNKKDLEDFSTLKNTVESDSEVLMNSKALDEKNNTKDINVEESVTFVKDDENNSNDSYYYKGDTLVKVISRRDKNYKYSYDGLKNVKDDDARNNWKAWLYLAPVLILMTMFLLYPLVDTIIISFMKDFNYVTREFDGFTIENYGYILNLTPINGAYESRVVNYAIPNTLIICFITVPVSIIIALLITVGLNSLKWFQKILQTIFFLPYVTNTIAIGMVFSVIFDSDGIFNYLINSDHKWITGADRWSAMLPLCLYIVWSSLPFKILVFLSGLQGIDKQYYQAAQIDATPKWKVFTKITVPLLSPQIVYIAITSFIGGFKEYSSIVGLFNNPGTTTGDYSLYTMVYYIYDKFNDNNLHYAAAAAVLLFAFILLFTALQMWVSKKRVYY